MTIKSLTELCIQMCQKHINQLTSFGNGDGLVPTRYAREILLRVTDPAQLRTIEINSPYIDTADVWKRLITRDFPVESRGKNYSPPTPTKWYEVYDKYFSERHISQIKAEEQLRRQFQGLQEQKDSRVSKLVDQRFLPRPPKTGRITGLHTESSKSSHSSSFGGGGKSRVNSGASILRRARREAANHALMRGVLPIPSRTVSPATVKKAPACIVEGRRTAAQPSLRPHMSPALPSTPAACRERPSGDARSGSIPAAYMAPKTISGARRSYANPRYDCGSEASGDSVEKRSRISIQRSPGKSPSQPVTRPVLLSNAPKSNGAVVTRSSNQQPHSKSNLTIISSSTSEDLMEPSARGERLHQTISASYLGSPEESQPLGPSKITSHAAASAQYSPFLSTRKRKRVDIFMPTKNRRRS
ncbi:hypothetical protein ACRALDRAFT_1075826 [Sodiomyces alcalophilus JCM 7366]|uniref:uncharacterized protein n=1 Tax=Sodiomyces alcalophilus JCM 7366 TaxID=591952 RepID=UPI0039B6B113